MREFGIESLSSSRVSRAARLLDEELEAWRDRPLGQAKYLILDARYEKMRHGGVVRDGEEDRKTIRGIVFPTNVLSAIGIGPDERRRVPGVSVALSEAEVHWRGFLESPVARGLRGVEFIVSDDHPGLRAARRAVSGGATWQRCQFHLARNAIHPAPNVEIRKRIGAELRTVCNAGTLARAENRLGRADRKLSHLCAEAVCVARGKRTRGARSLHAARAPSPPATHFKPDGAIRSAGSQAAHRKGQGPSRRRRSAATGQRRPGGDRRETGLRNQGLHQRECQDA